MKHFKQWKTEQLRKHMVRKRHGDEMDMKALFLHWECVNVYRSISSSSGVASPAIDIGVLSIMGLGEGRGVMRDTFLRLSASFSCSHCSAILPQSTAVWEVGLENNKGKNAQINSKQFLKMHLKSGKLH